ncbi:MAG: ATP-binding cassette domain-containing protein [Methanomassiliicoccales archaeon]|jgi:zinc/manganese transport system ATP-binding protein
MIEAKDLAVGFRENIVWQDANFSIDRGEFVAIIGPNGAGKTTLIKLLLGLQQPIRGTIKVFDAPPHRGNARIGYVPQRHAIDSEMTIEALEMVRLGFSGKRWGMSFRSRDDREAALDALKAVGAEGLAHRSLGVMSGGELQRVFLAEALVSEPDLLLLDEPLSNLDIRREQELVHLIDGVVRTRNVTALLIAHNINPLLPVLDKVIYIANGMVRIGRPEDVLTSESLTELYGTPIEVLHDSKGNIAVIGIEEDPHHCECRC